MSGHAALLLNCWHRHTLQWSHSSREQGGRPVGGLYHYHPPQQYASLARIAFAHCRLHHRQLVQNADIIVAIGLTEQTHAQRAFHTAAAEKMATQASLFTQPTAQSTVLREFVCSGMRPSNDGRLGVESLQGCMCEAGVMRQVEGWMGLMQLVTVAYNRHNAELLDMKDKRDKMTRKLHLQEEGAEGEEKDRQ